MGALFFSGMDVIFGTLILVAFLRRTGRASLPTPKPLISLAYLALAGALYSVLSGLLRGGNSNIVLTQVDRVFYLPVVFLLFQTAFRGLSDYVALGKVVIFAAALRACLATYVTSTVQFAADPLTGIRPNLPYAPRTTLDVFASATVLCTRASCTGCIVVGPRCVVLQIVVREDRESAVVLVRQIILVSCSSIRDAAEPDRAEAQEGAAPGKPAGNHLRRGRLELSISPLQTRKNHSLRRRLGRRLFDAVARHRELQSGRNLAAESRTRHRLRTRLHRIRAIAARRLPARRFIAQQHFETMGHRGIRLTGLTRHRRRVLAIRATSPPEKPTKRLPPSCAAEVPLYYNVRRQGPRIVEGSVHGELGTRRRGPTGRRGRCLASQRDAAPTFLRFDAGQRRLFTTRPLNAP